MKKMIYVVTILVIATLAYGGWKMSSRSAYESAEYSVLKSDGSIELRQYPELTMATTPMRSRQGNDGSFGRLFQYISGQNKSNQKVSMTTPVFMNPESPNSKGRMGFVIPRKVAEGDVPQPLNEQVVIANRPGGLFAVIRFSGREDEETLVQQKQLLVDWIGNEGYELAGEPEFAGYDPPWTPGFLRRNEILIRVRQTGQ